MNPGLRLMAGDMPLVGNRCARPNLRFLAVGMDFVGWVEQSDTQHCVGSEHLSRLCWVFLVIDEPK